MYPRINEMIRELHRRKISSFLVTNAQFPERIEQLEPVTQVLIRILIFHVINNLLLLLKHHNLIIIESLYPTNILI